MADEELNDLRKKVLDGEDVAPEEYYRIVETLRASRQADTSKQRGSGKGKGTKKSIDPQEAENILNKHF